MNAVATSGVASSKPQWRWAAISAGPLCGLVVYLMLRRGATDLSPAGCATAGVAVWMAVWWIMEALPLAATSLIPLVAFPLAGVASIQDTAAAYADKNIFLFLGGFLIAMAIERRHVHLRIALWTLWVVGTSPRQLVAGVMMATAMLSMWISNTATAAMMLPIGMSLVSLLSGLAGQSERQMPVQSTPGPLNADAISRLATCLMLGIAYAASIGGMATLVGTPTNLLLAGYAAKMNLEVGFARWMLFAVPLAVVYLAFTWWIFTAWLFRLPRTKVPQGRGWVRERLRQLGSMSQAEVMCLAVFGAVATLWIFREPISASQWLRDWCPPLTRLDDSLIAMAGAIALFVLPADRQGTPVLEARAVNDLPWSVLLLFGGGFSLSASIHQSHLDRWLGDQLAALQGLPDWSIAVVVVAMVLAATELTSNTPTLAAFLPVVASLAEGLQTPALRLLIPATIAASCAFMLPVATPPNAIVFASGHVTIRQMVWAGCWMNLMGLLWIPLYSSWMIPRVFKP